MRSVERQSLSDASCALRARPIHFPQLFGTVQVGWLLSEPQHLPSPRDSEHLTAHPTSASTATAPLTGGACDPFTPAHACLELHRCTDIARSAHASGVASTASQKACPISG